MNAITSFWSKLHFLQTTLHFYKNHFLALTGLGFIAAFGRVIQIGGFGPINMATHTILEIVVAVARIVLCLYVLGLANLKNGFLRLKHIFSPKGKRQWLVAWQNLKERKKLILINFVAFLLIAWALNYLIDLLAYETCLYLSLKRDGILVPTSSEWTVILFLKNLSIIPFTLMFEVLLVLWLTNKLNGHRLLQLSNQ